LIDKTAFHEYATQQGFPVPESYIARSKIELQTILAGIKFPVVIKPHFRTEQWLKKSKLHKVFKLHDVTELESIGFDLFAAAPRFLIQRWIPGGDDKVYFCLMYIDRRGQERGYYAGKKLLQWPRLTGNTAIAVGTTDEAIHKLAADVLLRTKARGLCSLEVKKSDEDGNYYITEPTIGRNNYQSYIAVAGGVNLTELAFHDAINEKKQIAAVHRKMAMWIDEDFSWRAIKSSIGREELHFVPIVRGLANRLTFSHLNLTDWMPFFLLVHGLLPQRLRKLLRYFRIFILHPTKTLRRK